MALNAPVNRRGAGFLRSAVWLRRTQPFDIIAASA